MSSSQSYRSIDYRVRPAKAIERKMLAEAFRRLSEFGNICAYQYIGFGSLYFSDFIYFHKNLGFRKMISIEDASNEQTQQRFKFNQPYDCIELKFGNSSAILPSLKWDLRSIVWLDYDGTLTKDVLSDLEFAVSRALPGSMVILSVNAGPIKDPDGEGGRVRAPIDLLAERLGSGKVPADLKSEKLSGWGVASAYRDIITNQIDETLSVVNGTKSQGAKIHYHQVFNFHYDDGVKMLTVGGVIVDEGQDASYRKCAFDQLEFFMSSGEAFKIETPLLTHKEMRHLDSRIPLRGDTLTEFGIPEGEVKKYASCYRYFPKFAEAEVG